MSRKTNVRIQASVSIYHCDCIKKIKGTDIRVEHRWPELIPDSRQSACRWQHAWSWTRWWAATTFHQAHSDTHAYREPGGRLPGLQLPSQPSDITAFRPVPIYIAWWQRHIGVKNLPKVFTLCAQRRIKPMTSWSQVWCSTNSTTMPPVSA